MRVLAFDTACTACSVAVVADGRVAARRSVAMERGHAEALIPMVLDVLGEAGESLDGIDGIGVTVGPGSFTGIRTGLAAARGFALAAGMPVVGVTTLRALARAAVEGVSTDGGLDRCLAAVETRRPDLYVQSFTISGDALGGATATMPEDVADLLSGRAALIAGDGASRLAPILAARRGHDVIARGDGRPDVVVVAELAAERLVEVGREALLEAGPPSPFYLRPPHVNLPAARTSPTA